MSKPLGYIKNVKVFDEQLSVESIDIVAEQMEKMGKAFSESIDASLRDMNPSLFFPVFEYEQLQRPLYKRLANRVLEAYTRYKERLLLAIEVLKGDHICADDY